MLLAFSGGGTRAAALSYGVLKELNRTRIPTAHGNRSLLQEVDMISSVSGGSFTAAYYGLLTDTEVDRMIAAGQEILAQSQEYRDFMRIVGDSQ